ncbi:protein kinase, partial [Spirulina sp. CS-785/01]|uniref:protein kinase domain-containing protein n=1 Tax=Spirulina sp. CS-785/01 TaxID=3021716 RepID=UPI0023311DF8
MRQCFNPDCLSPSPKSFNFCPKCGSKLLLVERYWAREVLGEGGFGRTFLAVDEFKPSKPPCVVKQFLPQAQGTNNIAKASELFAQEAERLEHLGKHPQIPELYAYFTTDNRQYLVQEWIEGLTLQQELEQQGVFSEAQIREVLADLLSILQFVHRNHVIHRDIKPENIIRRQADGKLVLVDFGAAKAVQPLQQSVTGTVIGSAEYCAPEQRMGKPKFISDLYSLGVTCLHLLTQVSPFELYDVMEAEWAWGKHLQGNSVSAGLGRILDRLVEPKPRQRYQSVTEVLGDLGGGVVASPPTGTPLASRGVGSFAGLQQKLAATDIDTLVGELRGLQHKSPFLSRLQRTLDLSSHVLREDKHQLASQLWGRLLVPETTQQSPEVEQLLQQVAARQQGLWLRPLAPCFDSPDGALVRTLTGHSNRVTAVAVTPEGQVISGSSDNTLKVWDMQTGKELRTLTGHSGYVTAVAVTPEGQVISGSEDNTLKVWDMQTGKELRTLTGHSHWITAVAVTPE